MPEVNAHVFAGVSELLELALRELGHGVGNGVAALVDDADHGHVADEVDGSDVDLADFHAAITEGGSFVI